jgi:hypothetical protein
MKYWWVLLIFGAVFVAACTPQAPDVDESEPDSVESNTEVVAGEEPSAVPKAIVEEEIKTTRDGTKYLVNPREFRSGGPGLGGIGRDKGIPALLDPPLVTAEEADYLSDDELVLGLVWEGEARAYPYQILIWHEIVNDIIQGHPLLVTYCPLCFTGVAFDALVDGKRELFGVSGKLYNSELVMYDKKTESYWPQSLGKAVVGERTGTVLEKYPIDVARWGDWKRAHPDTKVVSQQTGFRRSYGGNPYGDAGDFTDIGFRLGVNNPDPRLPEQTIVYGVEVDGSFTAYTDSVVREQLVINDVIGIKNVVVFFDSELGGPRVYFSEVDGEVLTFSFYDGFVDESGSEWDSDGLAVAGEFEGTQLERVVHEPIFWFAWGAFHPDTQLYS